MKDDSYRTLLGVSMEIDDRFKFPIPQSTNLDYNRSPLDSSGYNVNLSHKVTAPMGSNSKKQ